MTRLFKRRSPQHIVRVPSVIEKCSPFSRALLVAVVLHVACIAPRLLTNSRRGGEAQRHSSRRELRVQLDFVAEASSGSLDDLLDSPARTPASNRRNQPVRATNMPAAEAPRVEPRSTKLVASDPNAGAPTVPPAPEGPANPAPERKINLGLNGDFLRMLEAQHAADAPSIPKRRPTIIDQGAELTRKLNAEILADDVRRGLARGNVLLGALDSAVRHSGPTRGQALILVIVNAQGEVTSLELAKGDEDEWAAVLSSFGRQAKSKRVRVPTGAAGLRITFSVSAKVQRPSGKEVGSAPGTESDASAAFRELAMLGTFDLADLSNKSGRMLAIRVVSEEQL